MVRSFLVVCVIAVTGLAYAEDVTLGKLSSKTPAGWKAQEPSKLRIHTFTLPRAKGDDADAELAVFFFGAGSGGGVAENLKRWKAMFEAPDGKSIDDVSKVTTFKIGDKADLTYLDVTGTYLSKFPPFAPNAKITRKANHRMLAVVFECDDGPYFLRLTGPAATVTEHKTAFDEWLKNFK